MCKGKEGFMQEIDDGSASACCAKEALREALKQVGAVFDEEKWEIRFLQLNVKKQDEIHEGGLGSESLSAFIECPSGLRTDKVEIPEWPIAKWRALRIEAVVLDIENECVFPVWAIVVVAKCDRGKMPSFISSDSARGRNPDWAPVLACLYINHDDEELVNGFDRIFKFTHKILKCGVLNFSPESMVMIEER